MTAGGHIHSVTDFGAVPDGHSLCTQAIQKCIDACASNGGGTVFVPAGPYLTGALFLKSHITLHLDSGAVLQGSGRTEDFPVIHGRWEGTERDLHASLISGDDLTDIAITGHGTIDGGGEPWWERQRNRELEHPRPRIIGLMNCTNVLIRDVTLTNSPAWTVNPVYCDNVTIDNVTVINPPHSPNTDGINPDSCRHVHITNCHLDVGDDCVTIKSGMDADGRRVGRACERITITNCTMVHGHGGVVIGSEMSGDVRDVVISNCVFVGTDRGIRIKSRRGRGGVVEDIRVTNLVMRDIMCPFVMNLYYSCGEAGKSDYVTDLNALPVTEETPKFRNIQFSHITAREVRNAAGCFYGLPESPIEGVTFEDVVIECIEGANPGRPAMMHKLERMSGAGFISHNVRDIAFRNMEISCPEGPALSVNDGESIRIEGLRTRRASPETPLIRLANVTDASVRDASAASPDKTVVEVSGQECRNIRLRENHGKCCFVDGAVEAEVIQD